jgi:hypothetical protein
MSIDLKSSSTCEPE